MNTIAIGKGAVQAPQIGLGCMRITGLDEREAQSLIRTAMEAGVNFFDHADIYAGGEAEAFFAKAAGMTPAMREKMVLQSKCSIRPGICYDFSKKHILKSVDESLKRLQTDYLDILLLHRPDALMEPEEVAEAFATLEKAGKVKHFGVSNHSAGQIELLNRYCDGKIIINQMQLSVAHCPMIDAGINVNTSKPEGVDRDGGVLDYCRLNGITIQAWSPFQYGMFEGVFLGSEKFPELNKVIDGVAEKYGVTNSAIAVAWILRHPARIQAIVGTTNRARLEEICRATDVCLTREEWYEIYMAAGKQLP